MKNTSLQQADLWSKTTIEIFYECIVCFKVKIKKTTKEDAPLSHCFLVTRKNSGIPERSEDKEHRLVVYFKFRYFLNMITFSTPWKFSFSNSFFLLLFLSMLGHFSTLFMKGINFTETVVNKFSNLSIQKKKILNL